MGETTLFRVVAMDTSGRVRDGTDDSMNSELGRKRLLVTLSHWDYPLKMVNFCSYFSLPEGIKFKGNLTGDYGLYFVPS